MQAGIARFAATLVLAAAAVAIFFRHLRLIYLFREKVGYWPRLAAPRSFREKMQWRKIFDRNPTFVRLQDKLDCKRVVAALAPAQRMAAVLWAGTEPGTIPLASLPPAFVLKTNHGRGFNVVAGADGAVNAAALVEQGRRFLALRWGKMRREWAYAQIRPRLYVEELLRTADGRPPDEYGVTVMNGRPLFVTAQRRRGGRSVYGYYLPDWTRLPVLIGDGTRDDDAPAPPGLARMLETATAVGSLVDMLRVDFYDVDGVAYFGECTVYSVSGMLPIRPRDYDLSWGAQWDIRRAAFFTARLGPAMRLYRWALETRLGQVW